MTMQQCRNEANATSSQISQREINKFIRKRSGQKPILKSSGFATGHRKPSGKAFRQKAQSAMEYLMTYGWAILIIAIVLVAFFSLNLFNPYTFSPKASPGSCQILRPNGPGSNLFVSALGPTCTTNEIPQYVAKFNGNGYVNFPSATFMPAGPFTITAWVNPITGSQWYRNIISTNCFSYELYPVGYPPNYGLTVAFASVCGSIVANGQPTSDNVNTYAFVVVTFNGTALQYYNNGVSVGSPISATRNSNSITEMSIGENLYSGIGSLDTMYGSIANVQIYNTSLSPSGVNTLYAEGIGGTPVDIQNLVGWWPLNGNSNDYSGNGNNGVPTNVIFTSNWENGYSSP